MIWFDFFWVRGHPGIEVFIQDQVQVLIYFLKAEKLVVGLVVFSEAWSAWLAVLQPSLWEVVGIDDECLKV